MNNEIITLDKVLDSNTYVKENSGLSYKAPREYIEPFIEKIDGLVKEYKVSVGARAANIDDEDKTQVAYGRVLVEAKLKESYDIENHSSTIGLVYALDTQKPVFKVYSGRQAWACTNLCIFNAEHVYKSELLQGIQEIYTNARKYGETVEGQIAKFNERYTSMCNNEMTSDQIERAIGKLLVEFQSNKEIGTTALLSATKELYNAKSVYAINDGKTSEWNMYSAITQYITDKVDIVEKASKTLLISEVFKNLN